MNDKKLRRIIMENLPQSEKAQTTRIYLEVAVEQDLKSLGEEYCPQQFSRVLSELHSTQCLYIFSDGWIKPTACGLRGFGIS